MIEPGLATLSELSAALASGALTSQAIVENCLERIERFNPRLDAFAAVFADRALAQAKAHDALRAAGNVLGPLHGLPIGIKDLIEWPGETCTVGSAAWQERVSETEATVLRRLLSAGMIPIGRTKMVEMAFGGWGTNPLCGAPRNPWDTEVHRVPGGSSSGSGVAVAAGMVPAALGSDTGGSIRIPAAMNGLVGFKPTYGQVSVAGCFPLSFSLDSVCPMTTSVADAALLMAAISGPDPRDPTTGTVRRYDPAGFRPRSLKGAVIAVLRLDDLPVEVQLEKLAAAGAILVEIELPFDLRDLTHRSGAITAAEANAIHRDYIDDPELAFGPHVRGRIQAGAGIAAADYVVNRRFQQQQAARYDDFMRDYDAMVLPTVPIHAIPVAEVDETQLTLAYLTRPANYLGACALALPTGPDESGLPVSVQLMGRAFDDAALLSLAASVETAIAFPSRHPVI